MAVEIYKKVRGGPRSGQKLEKAMAWTFQAQRGLNDHARARATAAKAILDGAAERTGSSFITVERERPGSPDLLVTLNDTRGQAAANIIEFGRAPKSPDSTPSYAVAPLRGAFHSSVYIVYPRKPRGS